MTESMIERVAKAGREAENNRAYGLYDYSRYAGDEPPHVVIYEKTRQIVFKSHDHEAARVEYCRLRDEAVARAVIEALREPTPGMIEAGGHRVPSWGDASFTIAGDAFRAMIAAALKGD